MIARYTMRYYTHDRDLEPLLEKLIVAVQLCEQGQDSGLSCQLIYSGRNRLYRIEYPDDGRAYVVKVFGKLSLPRRLYYTLRDSSKAKRSWLHSLLLGHLEVGVAAPVGYAIESDRWGILVRGYYVSHFVEGRFDIQPEMYGFSTPAFFLQSLARFVAELHVKGVEHVDLSPGNVLYRYDDEGYHFYLVDVNRMHFSPYALEGDRALKGLSKISSSYSVSSQLAYYYALEQGLPISETVERVNEYSDEFFARRITKIAYRTAHRLYGLRLWSFLWQGWCYRLKRRLRYILPVGSPLAGYLFCREEEYYSRVLALGDIRRVLARREGYVRRYPLAVIAQKWSDDSVVDE